MASRTSHATLDFGKTRVAAAVVVGVVATAVMYPLQVALGMADVTAVVIPALYGISGPNPAAAWLIHLVHGTIFAVGYAAVTSSVDRLRRYATEVVPGLALGLAFGLVLALVGTGTLLPIWLRVVGFPQAPPIPVIRVSTFITHGAYGLVLGGGYPLLSRYVAETPE